MLELDGICTGFSSCMHDFQRARLTSPMIGRQFRNYINQVETTDIRLVAYGLSVLVP
jgi:hypothetical protein